MSFANDYVKCDEKVITCYEIATNNIIGNLMRKEAGESEAEDGGVLSSITIINYNHQLQKILLYDQKRLYQTLKLLKSIYANKFMFR